MVKERIVKFYVSHRGGVEGAAIGCLVAVAVLLFGAFQVVFVAICGGMGYYIGARISKDKEYLRNLLDRILPPGTYR